MQNTLTNKNEYITIQEELENLENYFAILRIRYAVSFEYSFDVEEEELLSCLVPKLILQPLAENSVMHGSSDDGSVMEIPMQSRTRKNATARIFQTEQIFSAFTKMAKNSWLLIFSIKT